MGRTKDQHSRIALLSNMQYAFINKFENYWVTHIRELKFAGHIITNNARCRQ